MALMQLLAQRYLTFIRQTAARGSVFGVAIVLLAGLSVGADTLVAQVAKPAVAERPRSERLAAIQAIGLGFQLQEWLADSRQEPTEHPQALPVAAARNLAIEVAARTLRVSLAPSPNDASASLPKSQPARMLSAHAIFKQWRAHIETRLVPNEYLLAHYMTAESIGNLRNLIASNDGAIDIRDALERAVAITRVILSTPHLEMSASLRAKWLDLAQDLLSHGATASQSSTLRTRLELWLDALSAELEARGT